MPLAETNDAIAALFFQQMKYLILEQKYFELIEDNHAMDALQCLRNEIQGLKIRIERTHELTTYAIDRSLLTHALSSFHLASSCSAR